MNRNTRCGERVHRACACTRPAGHAGPHTCAPSGVPAAIDHPAVAAAVDRLRSLGDRALAGGVNR